jgi:hypothetical protein
MTKDLRAMHEAVKFEDSVSLALAYYRDGSLFSPARLLRELAGRLQEIGEEQHRQLDPMSSETFAQAARHAVQGLLEGGPEEPVALSYAVGFVYRALHPHATGRSAEIEAAIKDYFDA